MNIPASTPAQSSSGNGETGSYARSALPDAAAGAGPGEYLGDDPPDGADEDEFEPL